MNDPTGDLRFPDDEWTPGDDGRARRAAARVLFLMRDRVLLLAGHEPDSPDEHFWWTPGGGIAPGEEPRSAAARELREETGLVVSESDLEGPVATWDTSFTYLGRPVHQTNVYYLCRVVPVEGDVSWTLLEDATLEGSHWMPVADVRSLAEPVYPAGLADLLDRLVTGWDGNVHRFAPQRDA